MSKTRFIKNDRRAFLKGAAVAGGAAVVAPGVATAKQETPLVTPVKPDTKGYEENEYIRNYYDRARF